ncbi:MAG: hypothetical protein RIT16_840, partial [Actinomycetota bacterium]
RDFSSLCIWRLHNVVRNGEHWAHDTWLYATFSGFVATLVLSTTSTPACIVGGRQDGGGLADWRLVHVNKATGYI